MCSIGSELVTSQSSKLTGSGYVRRLVTFRLVAKISTSFATRRVVQKRNSTLDKVTCTTNFQQFTQRARRMLRAPTTFRCFLKMRIFFRNSPWAKAVEKMIKANKPSSAMINQLISIQYVRAFIFTIYLIVYHLLHPAQMPAL